MPPLTLLSPWCDIGAWRQSGDRMSDHATPPWRGQWCGVEPSPSNLSSNCVQGDRATAAAAASGLMATDWVTIYADYDTTPAADVPTPAAGRLAACNRMEIVSWLCVFSLAASRQLPGDDNLGVRRTAGTPALRQSVRLEAAVRRWWLTVAVTTLRVWLQYNTYIGPKWLPEIFSIVIVYLHQATSPIKQK